MDKAQLVEHVILDLTLYSTHYKYASTDYLNIKSLFKKSMLYTFGFATWSFEKEMNVYVNNLLPTVTTR